jgi:hypothetical protein
MVPWWQKARSKGPMHLFKHRDHHDRMSDMPLQILPPAHPQILKKDRNGPNYLVVRSPALGFMKLPTSWLQLVLRHL